MHPYIYKRTYHRIINSLFVSPWLMISTKASAISFDPKIRHIVSINRDTLSYTSAQLSPFRKCITSIITISHIQKEDTTSKGLK